MPRIRGGKWEDQVRRGDGSVVLGVTPIAHPYPGVPARQPPLHASVNPRLGSGGGVPLPGWAQGAHSHGGQ